ncbi:MAG TPA: OB-fold domain-containing protein [Steroidobacteraceae bacterium]
MSDASLPLLKPALYARGERAPVLLGGRCECGHIFFPMQTFGCERCGRFGKALQPMQLRGHGRLRAAATVHVHADEKRPTPFTVGTIELDDGPVIRTLLLNASPDHAAPGTEVEAMFVEVETSDGEKVLDLRFRPVVS